MAEELIAAGVCSGGWRFSPISGSGFEGGAHGSMNGAAAFNWAASALDMFDLFDPRLYFEPPPPPPQPAVSISDGPLAFGDIREFACVSAPAATETRWSQADLIGSPDLIRDSSIGLMDDSSSIDPLMKAGENQIFSAEDNNCSTTDQSSKFPSPNLTKEAPRCSSQGGKKINKGAERKSESEPTLKKPRIETPSQLPTFKVRKEKLGDRITALQQLVSPFGKTDTASVLHEAIDYIKFLHDQVRVLSAPYLKKNNVHHQNQQMKEQEGEEDLISRGLCLVPVSATFAVARSENPLDFWAPFLGGAFR